jgi:hypothetical protein
VLTDTVALRVAWDTVGALSDTVALSDTIALSDLSDAPAGSAV